MSLPRAAKGCLLLVAAAFLLLRLAHLTADYPANIRWDDGIATDEGWYASSAVNQATWGHPLLPGDMNIPVLMPVWPAVAGAAFHAGGFSIVTLRATAVLFFLMCVALLCGLLRRYGASAWTPLFVAMLAVNPWAFAFSRSGFLEFPMLSFVLLAMLVAAGRRRLDERGRVPLLVLLGVGLVFAVAMLLKTTATALLPTLLFVVAERTGFRWRRALIDASVVCCASAAAYGLYGLLFIRPHMADVSFYLTVVKNTLRFTLYGFIADTSRPFRYGLGSDHLLFALSLLALAASLVSRRIRTLWQDPLYALAGVWLISFMGFMVKHNNDPARYFAITIPAVMLLAVALLRNTHWSGPGTRKVLLGLIAVDMAVNAIQISAAMLRPTYAFHQACVAISKIVREDGGSTVVIGDDMHEVALQTGLKPVNLLFHSGTITRQMESYQPGWWLQLAPIDDRRCFREVLSIAYNAQHRGEWQISPVMRLVLWKLQPIPGAALPATLTPAQTAACLPPVYN